MGNDRDKIKWILCPVCKKPNSADRDVCQYCWSPYLKDGEPITSEQYQDIVIKQEEEALRCKRRTIVYISSSILIFCTVLVITVLFFFTETFSKPDISINSNSNAENWTMYRSNISGCISCGDEMFAGSIKWTFHAADEIYSSPSVAEGVLYFGDRAGYLYAINTDTGDKIWDFKSENRIETSPAVYDNKVYFGSNTGNLFALNALSGNELWSFKTKYPIFSSPAIADGKVFFGAEDSYAYALDLNDGKKVWQREMSSHVGSNSVVNNGVAYYCSGTELIAVNAKNGKMRLRYKSGNLISSSPVIGGDVVYYADSEGYLYAVDGNAQNWTGESVVRPTWIRMWIYRFPVPDPPPPSGFLWAKKIGSRNYSSPAVSGNLLYAGVDNKILCLNLEDKEIVWSHEIGGDIRSSPVVCGDIVLIGSDDGRLYALDAYLGYERWSVMTGDMVRTTPAVYKGTIFVGSCDGVMYAIE